MDEQHENTLEKAQTAPEPDDASKPTSPTEITAPSWKYLARRSVSEFLKDGCMDLAAALTYFAVLSMFPALLAVVSLLGVFGQGEETTQAILDLLDSAAPEELMTLVEGPIAQLTEQSRAGFALLVGVLGALWTASGYVGAFGRAMNRIYEVGEGRPIWKLRPWNLLVTVVMVLIVMLMMATLVLSGGVARWVGDLVGLGDTSVTVWEWVKWPMLVVLAVALVALLYYATPNVRQPKFRWLSIGSVLALLVMGLAGAAFAFYVSNFSSYNKTYGVIGSVIVLLLGLWIMNNALLLGAELDAEIERGRQLQAGIAAEQTIQLPPRETTNTDKQAEQQREFEREGRELRASHGADAEPDAEPDAAGQDGSSRDGDSGAGAAGGSRAAAPVMVGAAERAGHWSGRYLRAFIEGLRAPRRH